MQDPTTGLTQEDTLISQLTVLEANQSVGLCLNHFFELSDIGFLFQIETFY